VSRCLGVYPLDCGIKRERIADISLCKATEDADLGGGRGIGSNMPRNLEPMTARSPAIAARLRVAAE